MADFPNVDALPSDLSVDALRQRLDRERTMIAVGVAELDRGEGYDWQVVKAWIEARQHDPEAKLPTLVTRP